MSHHYDDDDDDYDFTTDSSYDYDELREGYDADLSRNYIKGREIVIKRLKDDKPIIDGRNVKKTKSKRNDIENIERYSSKALKNIEDGRRCSARNTETHGKGHSKYSHGNSTHLQYHMELRKPSPRNAKIKKGTHSYIHVPLEEMEGYNFNVGKSRRKVRVVKPRLPHHQDFAVNENSNLYAGSKHRFDDKNVLNEGYFILPDSYNGHDKRYHIKAGKGDSLKLPSRHHAQYEDTNIDKVVVTMTPSEFKQKFSGDLRRRSFDGLQDSGDYGYIDDRKRLDTRNRRVSVKIEKNHDIIDNVETSMTLPNPAESNERNGFRYNNQSSNGEFESREIYNKLARDEGGMNAQSKQRESSRNYHEGNNTSLRRRKRSVFEGPNIESNVETGPENDFGNTGSSRGKENWKRIVGKVTESNQDNSNSSMSRGTSRGKENWKRIVRKLKESNNKNTIR